MALPNERNYRAAVDVDGLVELRKALQTLDKTANREMTKGLREGAKPVLAAAKQAAPVSDAATFARKRRRDPRYRHVRDTLRIRTERAGVSIGSRRAGATVIHFGGRHPLFGNRQRWYSQAPNPFVYQAIRRNEQLVVNLVGDQIEDAARRLGWRG